MLADSDRLMNTIEQVLRAARTSQTKQLNRSPVDLRALVQECVQLARLAPSLAAGGACEYQRYQSANPTVSGDLEELKAAISNLLDNAVKYSGQRVQRHRRARAATRPVDWPSE